MSNKITNYELEIKRCQFVEFKNQLYFGVELYGDEGVYKIKDDVVLELKENVKKTDIQSE